MVLLTRVLVAVAVLYLTWRLLGGWGRRLQRHAPGADSFSRFSYHRRERIRQRSDRGEGEDLIACEACGTMVPASRALTWEARVCCSEACRRRLQESEHG